MLLEQAGVDPAAGIQVVDAARLPGVAIDPTVTLLILQATDAADAALPGRRRAAGALAVLRGLYPPDHPLQPLPEGPPRTLAEIDADELHARDWLVDAAAPLDALGSPHALPWITARLRAPDGCPWDLEQDHRSLRRFVLEEAYETVDAIERGGPAQLADELGDVLLQVVLHAQLAAESGDFDLTDVYRLIGEKIVRRHPHVFGSVRANGVEDVKRNWESLKAQERAEGDAPSTDADGMERLLRAQPALPASRELQERASALGWDWPSIDGVWEKVDEELGELRSAAPDERLHEVGDVLFAVVNLARWLEIDPEEALRAANARWVGRFREASRLAAGRGMALRDTTAAEKDALWDEVKR